MEKLRRAWLTSFLLIGLMAVGGMVSTALGSALNIGPVNSFFYNNFENLYDSNGDRVAFDAQDPDGTPRDLQVGDHLFGIINFQNVDALGNTHWNSSPTDQITGVFAQRVEAILDPDPLAIAPGLPHVVLGNPTISNFGGVSTVGLLGAGEMFALWREQGAATTPFQSGGPTVQADVDVATDANNPGDGKWVSFGYSAGVDGVYGNADDSGYAYSHAPIGVPVVNFEGEAFGGLDVIFNNTGALFADDLNDPNEGESDTYLAKLVHEIYFTSEFEANPFSLEIDPVNGFSQWLFASNDPGNFHPVPEPSTMLLLGAGLIGLAFYGRKKVRG